MGSIETEELMAAELARELDVVVPAVGYRLAPEFPAPAALDDFIAV